jgi:C4-dicarboxylate-specific signal transduction histidine kinase
MARWNIRKETLPPASKILFQEVTIWERYRWQILTAVAVLIFQSVVITGLLFERYRRRAAERDSHQHLLEVTKMDRALTTGAMSSSISHELNQPLTAIMNNAEAAAMLLNADPLDLDELKAIIADIRRDDERAANIIKHLRMLLRQSELKPACLELCAVLTDSIALIEAQARENGVTLQTEIPTTPIRVRADYVHIQQVILNLALNAIEAMRDVPLERRSLQIRLQTKDDKAIISISDSGPGIPAEKMATIFNPFVTSKAEGTGLGLSIARTIIATYGGRIWAENNIAKGAVFQFNLNLVPATDIQAEAA